MKKGITITMMMVIIIVMIILATTITISVNSGIRYAELSTFANEIDNIQSAVFEETLKKSAVDFLINDIQFDVSDVPTFVLSSQFKGENIVDNKITLSEIDLSSLKISNTSYGNKKSELDMYAYSSLTQRVYYLEGISSGNDVYYTLTDELKNRFNFNDSSVSNSSIVSFVPSVQGYTNKAVKVLVKLPTTVSDVVITTNNDSIQINKQDSDTNLVYEVNSNNIGTNYVITVSYNDGKNNLKETYEINGYDNVKPTISQITDKNLIYSLKSTENDATIQNIVATDNESGIYKLMYIKGKVPQGVDEYEYFEANGTVIRKNKFKVDYNSSIYTICTVDKALNYTLQEVDIDSIQYFVQTSDRKVKRGNLTLEIGDIINYVDTAGENGAKKYAGNWKVLGAEDGELLIMSASDVDSKIFNEGKTLEGGKLAYTNGVDELNKICEVYGTGNGATKARCITAEDVNKVTGYDKTSYEYVYNSYKLKCGENVTYYWNTEAATKDKPYYEIGENITGSLNTSHSKFIYHDGKAWQESTLPTTLPVEKQKICTLTQTSYNYDVDVKTTLAKTNIDGKANKAYELLFGNDDAIYWLASPVVYNTYAYAYFGMEVVRNGIVRCYALVSSNGDGLKWEDAKVRAVVSLKKDINLIGTSSAGWNIV